VAYHDLRHERILTDMYTAQEVFADATITQHGELLTQVTGARAHDAPPSLQTHTATRARVFTA
jgi:hypothetical protein